MANIEVGLLETEAQLSSMIEASGKTVPNPGERANIVEHLDYMIELLGTMVSDETFKAAKKKMANGYNAINDRIEIINWMLASGEISGDVDLEPLTITENGEYMPGAGKGYSRVVVDTPEDQSKEIIERTVTSIENNAISIGEYAFYACLSLTEVSFPVCTSIGSYAFQNCSSLTEVSFPVCTSIYSGVFQECHSLTEVSFPVCTSIGNFAFAYCSSLTEVSFPVCTSIGEYAFQGCVRLISLYLLGSSLCTLMSSVAFNNTPISTYTTIAGQYGSIFVPASLVDQYKSAPNWSYYSDRITAYVEP